MAATVYKIIDVWLDEEGEKRVNPSGTTSSLIKLPSMTALDTFVFRFRCYEGGINAYPIDGSSDLKLIAKQIIGSDTTLLLAEDSDFDASHWPSDDTLSVCAISSISSGPFTVNNTVTGQTSSETGIVRYVDTTNNRIWLSNVSGAFTATEQIDETLPDGTTGATATLDSITAEDYDVTNGRVACELDTNTSELATFMNGRADGTVVFELLEEFSDDSPQRS